MNDTVYLPVKPSQVFVFKNIPLYCQGKDNDFILYKESGKQLDAKRLETTKHPELFMEAKDKDDALNELSAELNMDLVRAIAGKGLTQVKQSLCNIIEEVLTQNQERTMDALPDTIRILMKGYANDQKSLDHLAKLAANSSVMVEHTVNVLALTLQYAYFHSFEDDKIVKLALCAMLHDLGTAEIDNAILESKNKLSEKQFEVYKAHTTIGHDLLIVETEFDISVATVALEHHERIDGSGYPNALQKISTDSQLIGLVDCYENLTYRDKNFRKAKKPFDSLNLIKEEVKMGKFNKGLFKSFTSCLVR